MLTKGRKMPASVVETSWLITSAMLIPFDRMRVGINSESASHTQTPGPSAEGFHPVGGNTVVARDLNGCGSLVVRARNAGGRGEIAVGVNDAEGCATALDGVAGVAVGGEKLGRLSLIEAKSQLLIGADHGLDQTA